MLHLILNKISVHLIVTAFILFTLSATSLIVQIQNEQRDLTAQAISQFESISEQIEEEMKEKEEEKKIIYIDNFPVKTGHISSHYGMRKDPFTGKITMHKGMDIAANKGASVYPVGKGKVIFSGAKAGYGNTVEIEHSRTVISRYSHLKKSLVEVGQMVKKTDIIAQVGNTGRSTGPHLHLEIAFNGETANPRVYLSTDVASNQ